MADADSSVRIGFVGQGALRAAITEAVRAADLGAVTLDIGDMGDFPDGGDGGDVGDFPDGGDVLRIGAAVGAAGGCAAVVVATRNADLERQLGEVLTDGSLNVETTDDVAGTELASCAKNAAALASAAAASRGANLAGAAAGRVFAEVHELALACGARSTTFTGLAGTGDLVATALAEGSRNWRAGELVGAGMPPQQVQAVVEQTAESLQTVPLLDLAFTREGIDAPVTTGLRDVLDGRASADEWLESVRSTSGKHASHAAA